MKDLDNPSEETEEAAKNVNFENNVNKWVDYLVPRFHPRTVNVVKQYTHESPNQSFDIFTYGRNVWNTESFSEDFTDKIRNYVEECDLIQGFQVLQIFFKRFFQIQFICSNSKIVVSFLVLLKFVCFPIAILLLFLFLFCFLTLLLSFYYYYYKVYIIATFIIII